MRGTIMDFPLTVHHVFERRCPALPRPRERDRCIRAAASLHLPQLRGARSPTGQRAARTRPQPGERVATFAWNTYRHLELYFGVPMLGSVLHTLNIRLFEEQSAYIINHAEDRFLFVDRALLP